MKNSLIPFAYENKDNNEFVALDKGHVRVGCSIDIGRTDRDYRNKKFTRVIWVCLTPKFSFPLYSDKGTVGKFSKLGEGYIDLTKWQCEKFGIEITKFYEIRTNKGLLTKKQQIELSKPQIQYDFNHYEDRRCACWTCQPF